MATLIRASSLQLFVGAMNHVGGRHHVSARFYRNTFRIAIDGYEAATVHRIFAAVSEWHFTQGFSDKIMLLAKSVASAICSTHREIASAFIPLPTKYHYTFSLQDAWKVFEGVTLVPAKKLPSQDKLIRLWAHETYRVYSDRIVDPADRERLLRLATAVCKENFKIDLPKAMGKRIPIGSTLCDDVMRNLVFGNFMEPDSEAKVYDEVDNIDKLHKIMIYYLNEFNRQTETPMDLILFRYAIEHISRVSRAIHVPEGHCLVIGDGGTGKRSVATLAASMLGARLFHLRANRKYSAAEWGDALRASLVHAGLDGRRTVLLFSSSSSADDDSKYMDDVVTVMHSYEIPNLFQADEKSRIIDSMQTLVKERVRIGANKARSERIARRYLVAGRGRRLVAGCIVQIFHRTDKE